MRVGCVDVSMAFGFGMLGGFWIWSYKCQPFLYSIEHAMGARERETEGQKGRVLVGSSEIGRAHV